MSVLAERPFRSVVLERHGELLVVTKRFHHPNRFLARLDGARARREQAAHLALAARGLPVPRARAVRNGPRGPELELEAVPGAQDLRALLAARAAPPGGWVRLAARLGAVLARLHAAGFAQDDLHPGNVLVDARGAPWLVDLAHARRATPERARALDELVQCAAAAREHLAPRARLTFLAAWRRALPAELRPALAGAALVRAVEARARVRRRRAVRLGLGRWLRPSSRVRRAPEAGVAALARVDLADLAEGAEGAAGAALELTGAPGELRARWLGAARLLEHALPAARPALYVQDLRASFERPARLAPTRAALVAELVERGLALADERLLHAFPGGWAVLPPREPEDFVELD